MDSCWILVGSLATLQVWLMIVQDLVCRGGRSRNWQKSVTEYTVDIPDLLSRCRCGVCCLFNYLHPFFAVLHLWPNRRSRHLYLSLVQDICQPRHRCVNIVMNSCSLIPELIYRCVIDHVSGKESLALKPAAIWFFFWLWQQTIPQGHVLTKEM